MTSSKIDPNVLKQIKTGITSDNWRIESPYLDLDSVQQVTYHPFNDLDMFSVYGNTLYPYLSDLEYRKCAFIIGRFMAGDLTLVDHINSLLFLLAINLRSHNKDRSKIVRIFQFALTSSTSITDQYMINGKIYSEYIKTTYNEMKDKKLTVEIMDGLLEPLIMDERGERTVAQLSFDDKDTPNTHMARWVKILNDIKNSISLDPQQSGTFEAYSDYIASLSLSLFQGLWKNKVGVQQAVVSSFRGHLCKFLDIPVSDFNGLVVHGNSIDAICPAMYDRSHEAKVLVAASYLATILPDLIPTSKYSHEVKYMIRLLKAGILVRAEYFGMASLKMFVLVAEKTKMKVGELISSLSIGSFENLMVSWFSTLKYTATPYDLGQSFAEIKSPWGSKGTGLAFQNVKAIVEKPTGWNLARIFDTTKMGQFRPSESPQLYLAISQVALRLDSTLDINEAYAFKQYSSQDMTIAGLLREALLAMIGDYSTLPTVKQSPHILPSGVTKIIDKVKDLVDKLGSDSVTRDKVTTFAHSKRGRTQRPPANIKTIDPDNEDDNEILESDFDYSDEETDIINDVLPSTSPNKKNLETIEEVEIEEQPKSDLDAPAENDDDGMDDLLIPQ